MELLDRTESRSSNAALTNPALLRALRWPQFVNETGRRYGMLTVVEYLGKKHWNCLCDCGRNAAVYAKALRRGDATSCGCRMIPTAPADRFWDKVQKSDHCWEWTARRNLDGYGVLAGDRLPTGGATTLAAHRLSYEIHFGPIPGGLHVLHQCDNPPCVRPDHLKLGTHKDNMREMSERGRATRKSHKKLSNEDVQEIRRRMREGARRADVAAAFNVVPGYVTMIINGHARKEG